MSNEYTQAAAAEFAESSVIVTAAETAKIQEQCTLRARRMLSDLKKTNPHQFNLAVDQTSKRVAGICPRRAGKTYAGAAAALITCEAKPGAIVVVICLTLKQLRRNWWLGATSGLTTLATKYKIPLTTNSQELRWEHENGSIGYLLGAETLEQMEYIRGLEADLYIIDEGGSFAPGVLLHLLDDIIEPQRASRRGRIMMIGTPSQIVQGPFYEATNPDWLATLEDGTKGNPGCLMTDAPTPEGMSRNEFVSLHRWDLADNSAQPWLWEEALAFKKRKRWADDHPTWLREFRGRWVDDGTGLVYGYLAAFNANAQSVTWTPCPAPENPTGLPQEQGPWHLVYGLDLGFEDPTALVIAAYSETTQELRHVYDSKNQHLLVDDVKLLLDHAIRNYGPPEIIFADTSNLSLMIIETMRQRYGFPMEQAERQQKNDHIELLNADFKAGRIKIIAGTDLHHQLCSVPWDLSKDTKAALARAGKLVEDKKVPNDLTDAFLYLYRGCQHHYARPAERGPEPGTPEFALAREAKALARARSQLRAEARMAADRLEKHRGPQLNDLKRGRTPPAPPRRSPWT